MKRIFRYSGIAALSLSLIMLSLGSIPQTYAGGPSATVPSQMILTTTCGTTALGQLNWGTGVIITQTLNTANESPLTLPTLDAAIQNTGIGRAFVSMGVGTDGTGPSGGGYANDATSGPGAGATHIASGSIQLGLGDIGTTPFVETMVSGSITPVGWVDSASSDKLDAIVTVTGINLPAASNTWVLTIDVFQTDCQVI